MKFRRTQRFHGLKRPRIRQTWNKYNLYNLAAQGRKDTPVNTSRTFFQQKWQAKRLARGYHGEHIKERQWEHMFDRKLLSVVDMKPEYMAQYDGSEQATGRGSGKQLPRGAPGEGEGDRGRTALSRQVGGNKRTPYMQMAFAPMERRLDIAIFRALFASSARQARQFCVHGAVKVNGKKMQYPGYLLNPGDMFQVDVERVLYATGASKQPGATPEAPVEESEAPAAEEATPAETTPETTPEASSEESTPTATELEGTPDPDVQDEAVAQKSDLKALRDRLKTFLAETREDLSGKQKQALRSLAKEIKTAISRAGKKNANASQDVATLTSLFSELEVSTSKDAKSGGNAETNEYGLSKEEQSRFTELLAAEEENPYDPTKPYATPWRPRPYMSPFAFIPRYLEVNQKICSAVYLRHPVARQGEAEVPSPYGTQVNELAFNWYLRRH